MRVLVIDDDREFAEVLAVGLRREGLAVDAALDGST
jgi:DNA-binding response OmpR family regulator